jgi:hypothetical protein
VKRTIHFWAVACAAVLLSACGGNSNNGAVPSTTQANLGANKLQLAVGTAYNAPDGTTGVNFVETFRQPDGLSATLANTPSITGPAGFSVPSGFLGAYTGANVDIGTATISGSPQVAVNTTPPDTTLGTFTGAFSYGLAPLNSDNYSSQGYIPGVPSSYPDWGFTSSNYDVVSGAFLDLPFFEEPFGAVNADQSVFLIGPPAVPFFNNGTYPSGFAGYSPGFTAFEIPPVTGTYSMSVKVTTTNGSSPTFTATSNALSTVTPLTAPVISGVSENGGGLTGTVTVGAGVTETLVFVTDNRLNSSGNITATYYYTVEVMGTGAQTWTLPPFLGPCRGTGCQNSTTAQQPSLTSGDLYYVQAISFDYSALEDGPPGNTSQTPTLTGSSGQCDLAIGDSYPTGGGTYLKKRAVLRYP